MLLRPIYNDALSVLKRRAGSAAGASVAGIFSCAVVGMVCVKVFLTCCDDCIGEEKKALVQIMCGRASNARIKIHLCFRMFNGDGVRSKCRGTNANIARLAICCECFAREPLERMFSCCLTSCTSSVYMLYRVRLSE